jgi:ribosomal protein S18 acetylase RimI-like enzyme
MNGSLQLTSAETPGVELRAIGPSDLESLRLWKNAHRRGFFFQGLLTPEDQKRWFDGYRDRPDDYLFILSVRGEPIGCIGLRLLDGSLDVYNVILGVAAMGGQGWMRQALRLLGTFALARYPGIPIGLKVLRTNPAVGWYQRNGFVETTALEEYLELRLDLRAFPPCAGLQAWDGPHRPTGG